MKFHPVISIILGLITAFILLLPLNFSLLLAGLVFAGFIATFFTKEMKIRYGICAGMVLMVLFTILTLPIVNYVNFLFNLILEVLLPVTIGSLLGKMANKSNRKTFKTKLLNRKFSPITTIIAGIFITITFGILLYLISCLSYPTILNNSYIEALTSTTAFIVASLVGGFIATYFAKKDKIQYGFYEAIGLILIIGLLNLYQLNKGYLTSNYLTYIYNPYFIVGATAGYILAAIIGSYIGKRTNIHLKQTTKTEF